MTDTIFPRFSAQHEFSTACTAETVELGRRLAGLLPAPRLMILRGDLGAGKTTLVKGFAQALNAAEEDEVTSPTFTLLHEYEGEWQGKSVFLSHLDLYRLDGERQLATLGIEDLLTPDAIVLIEWGEKFPSLIRRADGEIFVQATGFDQRRVVVTLR